MSNVHSNIQKKFDFFLSHAREDKETVVLPLYSRLTDLNFRVWLDEFELLPGDKLRPKINDALADSRCGIVVLSRTFLRKEFPSEELNALMALEKLGTRLIPILHGLNHETLLQKNPLLANNLFFTTEESIDSIADRLRRLAEKEWSHKARYSPGAYADKLPFPLATLTSAIEAIRQIARPSTWMFLRSEVDLSVARTWMGNKDERLILIGFEILLPLLIFAKDERILRRSRATYAEHSKFAFDLLSVAYEAYTKDEEFASRHGPPIDYSPQVRNWRQLRESNPGKYLWQGLDRDTLLNAVKIIERTLGSDFATISKNDFIAMYRQLYDSKAHGYKEIGLLYNPIYRFIPSDRPVFCRLLCLWFAVYTTIVESAALDGEIVVSAVRKCFQCALDDFANLVMAWPPHNCHEPAEDTKRSVLSCVTTALPDRFGREPTLAT
jgi:TIR domain